jgi:hypothetical protein
MVVFVVVVAARVLPTIVKPPFVALGGGDFATVIYFCLCSCTLAPISNIESLDFCAISESERNVFPFKFVCEHTILFESHLFFLSFVGVT